MNTEFRHIVIVVKEILGSCPVYKVGDRIFLEHGYILNPEKSSKVCLHSLASVMPYYTALSRGIPPKDLGLCREGHKAYVQCLDPCRYTGGGTVIFEISHIGGENRGKG